MKRLILSLCILLCTLSAFSANPVRIMGIGNSFTVDALEQHFQPILDSMGIDAIVGYPYLGGVPLCNHDRWTRQDTLPYNYREFRNGKMTTTGLGTYNLKMALEKEPWDYVVIQSDYDSAGICKSYIPYMEHLIDFVKANCSNKSVKIGFYMTWAYDSISTRKEFQLYKSDNHLMYDSIIAAAHMVMAKHPDLEFIIPSGTAIQNARTSYKGQTLNRDGYHLDYDYGRYITSLCWYSKIFNADAESVTYTPASISDYCGRMCRAAAKAAIDKPFEVTSLAAEFGKSEEESVPEDESRLRRVTFNGLNIPIVEGQLEYIVPVDAAITPSVSMYSFPISSKAEQNITNEQGSDIERDVLNYGYFPLATPALGDTITYTNRVIAADKAHVTTYTFRLVGISTQDLVYTIGSKEDLVDFAATVNGGQYGINAVMTNSFSVDYSSKDCWKTPIGTMNHPYTGTFDGQNYTISGFNIYSVDDATLYALEAVGLFGSIKNATLANINIEGTQESYFNRPSTITSKNKYCGILCGYMESSAIRHCSVSCPIFTNLDYTVAYICSYEKSSTSAASVIEGCYAEGTMRIRRAGQYAGILAYGYNVHIANCYSLNNLQLQKNFAAKMGGILAYTDTKTNGIRSVSIANCYFAGELADNRPENDRAASVFRGAIAAVFNGSSSSLSNCHYLEGSAPSALAQHMNNSADQNVTTCTAADLKDGTLTAKLGNAFVQGISNPEIDPDYQPQLTALEETTHTAISNGKFLQNGRLIIVHDNTAYTVLGAIIK